MSRAGRRALVERENAALPVSQQCRLLAVSRSSVYRQPTEVSEVDRAIMALIDRQYLARPYYGSRRMAAWLATQGHVVNRKAIISPLSELAWEAGKHSRSAKPIVHISTGLPRKLVAVCDSRGSGADAHHCRS